MVSPPFKDGYPVQPEAFSADGSRAIGSSLGTFAGSEGIPELMEDGSVFAVGTNYVFTRGASGWVTAPIGLPGARFPEVGMLNLYSSGLRRSLWLASTQPPAGFSSQIVPYLYLGGPEGSLEEIGSLFPPGTTAQEAGQGGGMFSIEGASSDFSHVLFTLRGFYWPGDGTPAGGLSSLYEYAGTGNTTPLPVGVSGGAGSTGLIGDCGTQLVAGSSETGKHPVSADGRTVFFRVNACAGSLPVSELFARVDNEQADAHTVAISEPSAEDCAACDTDAGVLQNPTFEGASVDGSKAFFTTDQPLLGKDVSSNLYEYDFDAPAGERLIRVSAGDGTASEPAAGVLGVSAISEDGSRVFFTATGVLTKNPNGAGFSAQAGAANLYMFERDVRYPAGRTVFVTDLCTGPGASQGAADSQCPSAAGGDGNVINVGFELRAHVRLSSNGRFLVFFSFGDLTPDDTSNGAVQLFEYDAQTGRLVRASAGQNGYNEDGNTDNQGNSPEGVETRLGGDRGAWVADDGAVFFESADGLAAQAPAGAQAIYEYREGDVGLIGEGALYAADASGQNVFFLTYAQLLSQDGDTQADLYDARAGGGFPSEASQSLCEGDACQGPLSPTPTLLAPGSESQTGGANLPPVAEPLAAKPKAKPKAKKKQKKRTKRKARGRRERARRAARVETTVGARGGRS